MLGVPASSGSDWPELSNVNKAGVGGGVRCVASFLFIAGSLRGGVSRGFFVGW